MAEILLIEDDVTIRTALTRGLRELGHVVSSSPTALDGLRLAVRDRPDLVVLDLGLPDLDGAELLPMLRAVSKVPVIVATARDGDAEMVPILNSGADDYVVKPFSAASSTPVSGRSCAAWATTVFPTRRSRSRGCGWIPAPVTRSWTVRRLISRLASSTSCTSSRPARERW